MKNLIIIDTVTYYINNTLKITKKCLFFIDIVLTRHN